VGMPVSIDINKTLLNSLGWNSIAEISLSPSSRNDGYDASVRFSLRFSFPLLGLPGDQSSNRLLFAFKNLL
jgi:hypothetical protein